MHNGQIYVQADNLGGGWVFFDVISVGATNNIMLAAALIKGKLRIDNASMDPCVVDVAEFLNCMGADIRGARTDTIHIRVFQLSTDALTQLFRTE